MNSIIIAFAILLSKLYEMTKYKFHPLILTLTFLLLVVWIFNVSSPTNVHAQQPTDTPAPATGLFVTVVTNEPQINVRMGPSATVYPVIGVLLTGSTVPALGRSKGGDWVQIEFASGPNGKGWVYSPLVEVSPAGSTLIVVDAPPTPVQPATSTIDPTLAAQFIIEPTSTHLPTFTPAPTLIKVQFEPSASLSYSIPWASIIIALAVLGVIGFLLSLVIRR
ncbi:MAG TPA: SH3 domain-containing protein [Anaerolineales bacterium]|nr:SH3 domain-containing protein [Anaerolineales bacterium]